ncbi:MAG: hypothetical protein ACK5LC_08205 [Coprobacillaceae bacterium]
MTNVMKKKNQKMKVGVAGAGTIVPDFLEACLDVDEFTIQCISALENSM